MRKGRLSSALTLTVLYGLMSLTTLFVFLVRPGMTGHHHADFPQMVYGQADKPYVARAAMPLTVRALTAATPRSFQDFVHDQLTGRRITKMFGWYDQYLYEFSIAALLMLLCLIGFAYALRNLTEFYCDFSPVLTTLGPVVAFVLLPLFFRYYSYLYDPSTLLLFTWSLVFLVRRRFVWFAALFALAALNKETSILLIALFILNEWFLNKRVPAFTTVALILIWLIIRGALAYAFRDNPGAYFENHFREHNVWFLTRFPMAMRYTIVVVAVFFFFLRHDWRKKSKFLRAGMFCVLAPLVLAGMFFGFVDELRGYYEVFPFLYLLSIPTIFRFLSGSERPERTGTLEPKVESE